jgi:hypothetical protein
MYAVGEVPVALRFESLHSTYKRQLSGWEVVGNRFRGDAQLPPDVAGRPVGIFDTCVKLVTGRDVVGNVRVSGNTFWGCRTQVSLHAAVDGRPRGGFTQPPEVTGNIGDGTIVLEGFPRIPVGGNLGERGAGGSRFTGPTAPRFTAPVGSLYTHTGGPPGRFAYVNADGGADWRALAYRTFA